MPQELTLEEEQRLLDRAREGDGEAFGSIYDAFKNPLYKTVIFPKVKNETIAEEILQDTFMLAVEKLADFEWQGKSIFFWLRMIAINKIREWIAGKARAQMVDSSVLDYQPDNRYLPEDQVVLEDFQADLNRKILETLDDVNERYRDAIRLRLFEKKTREECAAALQVTVETFDVVFFRACKAFKKEYINKYGEL